MLSLLSRIVSGTESEIIPNNESEEDYESSKCSSSLTGDTDEEVVDTPPPIINIDKTELAKEAIFEGKDDFFTSSEQTDSCEDIKSASDLDGNSVDQTPVIIPSKDVCQRIVELVEYYLSDANLVKDMFLLKHVTKHREGYVSLKLLASYKKVKRLTKDWRVVAHALKCSKSLELNSDENKTRRRSQLPAELEEDTRPFRTLLATHISQDLANMNQLAEYFGKFGDMVSVQVHKPGGRTLNDVRQADQQHPGIVHTICAVIEYEKVHCARQALRYVNNNAKECNMKVMEYPRKKQGSLLDVKVNGDAESAYYSNSDISEPPSPIYHARPALRKLKTPSSSIPSTPGVSPATRRRPARYQISSPESSPPSPYNSNNCFASPCSSPEEHPPSRPFTSCDNYPAFRRYEVPGSLPLPRRHFPSLTPEPRIESPRSKGRNTRSPIKNSSETIPLPLSPWLRRRAIANQGDFSSPFSTPSSSPNLRRRVDSTMMVPENVMRFPKGPDGTKGFSVKRSMLISASA